MHTNFVRKSVAVYLQACELTMSRNVFLYIIIYYVCGKREFCHSNESIKYWFACLQLLTICTQKPVHDTAFSVLLNSKNRHSILQILLRTTFIYFDLKYLVTDNTRENFNVNLLEKNKCMPWAKMESGSGLIYGVPTHIRPVVI